MEALSPLLFPALLVVAFYLLIIRPTRTRARAAAQLQAQLEPGLEIMTTSGMFATVSAVEDDAVLVEPSPGVRMRYSKAAIARIVSPRESEPEPAPDLDAEPGPDQPAR